MITEPQAALPFFTRIRRPPQLFRRDLWLTVIPLALWLFALHSRPLFLQPTCSAGTSPTSGCAASRVPAVDRPGIGNLSSDADYYSYVTQNSTWVLAAAGPGLYQASLTALSLTSPAAALSAAATDTVIFAQTWFINGFINESARLVAKRARPFLYADPKRGQSVDPALLADPQNYTSFYSGHTSFVTAACLSLLLMLLGRSAPIWLLIITGLLSECLVVSTGVFRILAGRHFLTDVLTAIVMGTLSALFVAAIHRNRASSPTNILRTP